MFNLLLNRRVLFCLALGVHTLGHQLVGIDDFFLLLFLHLVLWSVLAASKEIVLFEVKESVQVVHALDLSPIVLSDDLRLLDHQNLIAQHHLSVVLLSISFVFLVFVSL